MHIKQSQFIKHLTHTPQLYDLNEENRKIIIALRITTLAKQKKINIGSYLCKYFQCPHTSKYFLHMYETIEDTWPDKIYVHKPCSQSISYDEMLITDLIEATLQKYIMHFHGLLCEMLSKSQSERLHHNIVRLIESNHDKKVAL